MEPEEESEKESSASLSTTPAAAHAAFSASIGHIEEVRMNHQKVLSSAGLVPEMHLSGIAPERALEWLAEELNGEADEKGIRLPLLGLDPQDVDVSVSSNKGVTTLKMELGEHIHRVIRLPEGVLSVSTSWNKGWLDVTFQR